MPSCVIATRDSLFCKMFTPLFYLEQKKTFKNVSKKLLDKEKKKKQRRKIARANPRKVIIKSSGTREV